MKDNLLVSVIIPAYKQEKTIVENLKKIEHVLEDLKYKNEIICVVDGMMDNTFKNAQAYAKSQINIRVIGYQHNKGKGYAVRFGMAESKGSIVAFIDAGFDIEPNALSICLQEFEWDKVDIIVGSKRHPQSKVVYPWQRRILSFGYQFLVWALFGLNIRDTQVGLKIFRREVLEKVLPRLLVKAFAFDVEMLAVANYLGFHRIYEAPVEVKLDFGGASVLTSHKFLKSIAYMLIDTLAVFYRLRVVGYYSDKNKRKWKYDPELNFRVNLP